MEGTAVTIKGVKGVQHDLTGSYKLRNGSKGTIGDMSKDDVVFIKRNHSDIKVIKVVKNQMIPNAYMLVDAKYVNMDKSGKSYASKRKRRTRRKKRSRRR